MLGFYPEAMQLLESKKIHTPQDWLAAINEMIKQREQQYLNEHFSDLKGTLLLIDSKNDKIVWYSSAKDCRISLIQVRRLRVVIYHNHSFPL